MGRKILPVALVFVVVAGIARVVALPTGVLVNAPADNVWHDEHQGYPPVPDGLTAIRKSFGEPCSADARANQYMWIAQDNKQPYTVYFHKKLGGAASSNLDNDVPGHMTHDKADQYLKSGIWGYNCRYKRTSSGNYSVHAWGLAVDINTAYEAQGASCKTVPNFLAKIWQSHRWNWGLKWKDCMHFQYATTY